MPFERAILLLFMYAFDHGVQIPIFICLLPCQTQPNGQQGLAASERKVLLQVDAKNMLEDQIGLNIFRRYAYPRGIPCAHPKDIFSRVLLQLCPKTLVIFI